MSSSAEFFESVCFCFLYHGPEPDGLEPDQFAMPWQAAIGQKPLFLIPPPPLHDGSLVKS